MTVFSLTYQGKSFNQRQSDGYVNLGQLCATHNTRFQNWSRLDSSKAYLEALSANTQISVLELVISKRGNEGTWGHPLVAIEVARWINPAFGVWCNMHIKTLIETGSTSIEQPKLPQDYLEALKALVASEEEKRLIQAQNSQLIAKIEEDAPKVALAEAIAFSDDSIDFNAYAKIVGTGRTRLFRAMRDCGVIMKNSTLPYQKWIDAGYFEISEELNMKTGQIHPFALVTGKGQIWLKQRLDRFKRNENNFVAAICHGVMGMSNFN